MKKIHEEKVNQLIHSLGLKYNLRDIEIKEIIESQFKFAQEKIKELELEGLTQEQFEELKTTFYFKYIGKLHINSYRFKTKEDDRESE